MAIKWLDAKRLQGTNAERLAMSSNLNTLGSSANATNSNVTLDTTNEKLGTGCLDFNGTDGKLSIPAQANLVEGLTEWSVSIWVWVDDWSDGTEDKLIMSQWNTRGSDGSVFRIEPQNNQKINIRIRRDDDQATMYTGGTACDGDGTWNHVVFNFYDDGGQKGQLYINGSADSAGVVSFPNDMRANADDTALEIGDQTTQADTEFSGKFDDIGFWSRKLTTAEITALYNGGTGALISTLTDTSGLRAYYNCDSATVDNNAVAVNPSLPNGTIFNETDAYKYFMWNGTDTWNQMVSS